MYNIWTIAKREYKHYFISPIAYVAALMLFLILGIIFYANVAMAISQQSAPSIQIVVGPLVTILLFTTAAVTMRTIADEQRSGTLELLLTAPVRDWELITGKWLGAFIFMATLVLATVIFPIFLNYITKPGIDQGLMTAAYLGVLLLVGVFVAVGVFISSLVTNQIAAFFLTWAVLLVFWMIGYVSQAMGSTGTNAFLQVLSFLDLSEHFYGTFYAGILELKDILYYVSVIFVMLFFGTLTIESRRWR